MLKQFGIILCFSYFFIIVRGHQIIRSAELYGNHEFGHLPAASSPDANKSTPFKIWGAHTLITRLDRVDMVITAAMYAGTSISDARNVLR